jgi:hypothetical protein
MHQKFHLVNAKVEKQKNHTIKMTEKNVTTEVKVVKINDIKPNPNNPRIIKDDKFKKLVESVKSFPEMVNVRPIVVNTDMIVLGGNMRLKAMKEAGWKEAPIQIVDWDEQKQKEFIVKDNVGYGEWDWDDLANNWDAEELTDWGLTIPNYALGHDINSMDDTELDLSEEFNAVGISTDIQRVVFLFDNAQEAEKYLKNLEIEFVKRNMAWQVNMSTQSI